MNRKCYIGILCILLTLSILVLQSLFSVEVVLTNAQNSTKTVRVIVDCGHGGEDGGAVSANGIVEKDINLDIGLTLEELLVSGGFEVKMIRNSDVSIHDDSAKTIKEKKISDIHNRSQICNSSPDNIYISIHQNKFEQSKYKGTQIFYSANNSNSSELAESIRFSVKELLQGDNERMCKAADSSIYILNKATVPSVLVECGFLSNPEEESLLSTEKYRNQIAFAVYSGFLDFYNKKYR